MKLDLTRVEVACAAARVGKGFAAIDENDLARESEIMHEIDLAEGENQGLVSLSANLEMEIASLPDEDREVFQHEMGIKEPALNKMIRNSYNLLGLMSYFTAGEKEVRAWTIKKAPGHN